MSLAAIQKTAQVHHLFVMGTDGARALLGTDSSWWAHFTQTDEYLDGDKDPVDRWSKRVITAMAAQFDARALFPSDGPPYAPFIAWALATKRFWQSPTGMMVHDRAGLMISIRGALECRDPFPAAEEHASPCDTCIGQPCVPACPVDALSNTHSYDVPVCKQYLGRPEGSECMTRGCQVRRACPISQDFARPDAQSAFHMQAFLG